MRTESVRFTLTFTDTFSSPQITELDPVREGNVELRVAVLNVRRVVLSGLVCDSGGEKVACARE